MKLFFLNNDGGGFANNVDAADGTTVSQFFAKQLPDRSPADYMIRVNRLPATAEQILHEGDRISITPTKISGAAH